MKAATIISKKKRTINFTSVEDYDSVGDTCFADFHPNGKFLCVGGNIATKEIIIYSWNGSDTLAEVETFDTGAWSSGVWHKDGNFLAVRTDGDATNSVRILSWNGTDTLSVVETVGITAGSGGVKWHPSGDYLAVVSSDTTASIQIYSWNGTDTLTQVETLNTGASAYASQWSNNGNYLSVTGPSSNKELVIYSWNGSDTLTETASYDLGAAAYESRWTSDDAYVFVCATQFATYELWAFAFNGSDLTYKNNVNLSYSVRGIDLYNDKYIALGLDYGSAASQGVLKLYSFSTTTESFTYIDGYTTTARACNIPCFNSNGTYIAAPMLTETNVTIRMIKVYS